MFDLVDKFFLRIESFGYLYSFIVFILVVILLNLTGFLGCKIRYKIYLKNRTAKYKKMRKKYKIDKIFKKLEKRESVFALSNANQRRLEGYYNFLIRDMKFNLYSQYRTFNHIKRASIIIKSSSPFLNYKGKPKKLYKQMIKSSRKKPGFLTAYRLLDEGIYYMNFKVINKGEYTYLFYITLKWTEYH